MLGLCLVAALALGAYAVSSASALEWGKCELAGPGHNYTGPNCTKSEKAKPKGTGEYEWRKASEVAEKRVAEGKTAGVPFTGHNVGSGGVLWTEFGECGEEEPYERVAETLTRQACEAKGPNFHRLTNGAGPAIECTGETNSGETEGKNKVANIQVTFTGCLLLGAVPCENEGAGSGAISTNTLKGKLGWLSKASKEVGVLLEPAKKPWFAEFECPGLGISVKVGVGNKKLGAAHASSGCVQECPAGTTPEEEKHGGYDGVISPIVPVNEMTSTYTQEFKVTGEVGECPENSPTHFEGKHIDLLEDLQYVTNEPSTSLMMSCSGEEITNVNESEEAGEIKA